ncbi:hypothetical protein CHS0354_012150 [Potamilus streckersoni]|uniref:Ubiquitin carboxyl-terminal hydrolase MINDY n=1 Tax=Potamilus streckersoni TaxID=2493646 RepID=A0AAE0SAG2_9BIVA|nr:hypothetical protein CHS0354_012150 [Potamilus streckersoni]
MSSETTKLDDSIIAEIKHLIWESSLKDEVFNRWTQGFVFSEHEPTALVQHNGGPCAVIAPVQGFLLRNALFSENAREDLSTVSGGEAREYLVQALGDILVQVSSGSFCILSLDQPESQTHGAANEEQGPEEENAARKHDTGESSCKRQRLDQESFHSRIRCTKCKDEESMRTNLKSKMDDFQNNNGVLLYLYSLVLTKGLDQIKNEVEDPGQPLIDGIHGHGSQVLINLMITGKAVNNVWDDEKEVSGLKLQGIPRQAVIGFLTYMEHLRYCEVGWYLKNPKYPVWLLASETHITVLFSREKSLVVSETPQSSARQVFQRFDPEGNGFISTSLLEDLMNTLGLVSDKEYVDIMKEKLDAENLGIITLSSFMEEFYPGDTKQEVPEAIKLYHYNGISRSCLNNMVKYTSGTATLQDELEIQIITDVSPIKLCLMTKWPTIDLQWEGNHIPSLN